MSDLRGLLSWIEGLTGPVDAVTAAGYANDLSPWPTRSPEWSLFIAALSDDASAIGSALALVERTWPGCAYELHGGDEGVLTHASLSIRSGYVMHPLGDADAQTLPGAILKALLTALLSIEEES